MVTLPAANPKLLPLCVDVDGTIIRSDLLLESLVIALRNNPWLVFAVPFWLLRGRAVLKRELAKRAAFNPAALPYNSEFIEWLRTEHHRGRDLVLVTAADHTLASAIGEHLGLFSVVLASDGTRNLKGRNKRDALAQRFPEGFEYAGDSAADLEVWRGSAGAILVNAPPALARRVDKLLPVVKRFDAGGRRHREWAAALRLHQWAKNILIFVPLVTSHQIFHVALVVKAGVGFLLFSICASGQYILNDLFDLEADRRHSAKRRRPFASGALPIRQGLIAAPLLLLFGFGAGFFVSRLLAAMLLVYVVLSFAYSLRLKSIALLDVFVLSGLYTFRVIAGHLVTGVPFSEWLLSFCVFLFLSLAFSKRTAELRDAIGAGTIARRGYEPGDIEQINLFGVCSAFLAAVVFILYLQSENVRKLYHNPELLWLLSPVFLYWASRIWLLSFRGQIHEDPVIFVLKDRVTYAIAAIAGIIMLAAT
jgi:4-hydroxybenzoate polyprenyltransferase